MANGEGFKERYRTGDTPWDAGQPDDNLIEVVAERPIGGCQALEIGCGTGDNTIWLSQNGFKATGIDISDIAIEKAIEKAIDADAECSFLCVDFLTEFVPGIPFGFAFDRGCFHSFDSKGDRSRYAQNVAAHLGENGLWLTLVGNADEPQRGPGPPRRSALDIILAAEPHFEILTLQSVHFGTSQTNPPRAWRCLMRKRSA